jgi:hypothetical protein
MPKPRQLQQLLAQLHRARLSSDDFAEASEYLLQFGEVQNDVLKRGLLTASVICYCRPFTASRGGFSPHATAQLRVSLRKLFTPQERKLHDTLMSLRNEVVAHTAYSRKPVRRLKGSASGFTMSGKLFDLLSERIDTMLFSAMCGVLRGHCFNSMMQLNAQIVDIENAP